jgi:hypothetical protein
VTIPVSSHEVPIHECLEKPDPPNGQYLSTEPCRAFVQAKAFKPLPSGEIYVHGRTPLQYGVSKGAGLARELVSKPDREVEEKAAFTVPALAIAAKRRIGIATSLPSAGHVDEPHQSPAKHLWLILGTVRWPLEV